MCFIYFGVCLLFWFVFQGLVGGLVCLRLGVVASLCCLFLYLLFTFARLLWFLLLVFGGQFTWVVW